MQIKETCKATEYLNCNKDNNFTEEFIAALFTTK